MSRSIRVGVLGASGYGASELLRILAAHAQVEVVGVTSHSNVGQRIDELHPHLAGFYDLPVTETLDFDRLLGGEHAVLFSALPNGVSGVAIDRVLTQLERGGLPPSVKVIDLSGDMRITDAWLHEQHYPDTPPLPERRRCFVYGLPELFREKIRAARFVANPGCFACAATLAAAPLIADGLSGKVVVDAKTGSSGSGRSLKETTHHPSRHADFRAYKPLTHQHEPEVLQAWGDPLGQRVEMSFVSHSMDLARGIFVTIHANLAESTTVAALRQRYATQFAGCPFVRLRDGSPTLQDVVGSNFCDISVMCRDRQVIAMAALDNLVKGMAGTAIQNMNLMCGLPETCGLWTPSFRPV